MADKRTEQRIKELEQRVRAIELEQVQLRTTIRLLTGVLTRHRRKLKE